MRPVNSKSNRPFHSRTARGFSLVELVVALAIAMVLAAIAIPSVVTTYNQYRLGVQATLIAGEIDQLRMTAVRRNSTVTLFSTPSGSNTILYIDANKSGILDSTDPQFILPADMQISNSLSTAPTGMPDVSSLPSTYSTAVKLPSTGITFGANGTINAGAGPYFIVIGYTNTSKYGYRAVTVTPMGQIKVWTASSGGSWSSTS
jgi:prepilin-type N-terminal cleavage/methylation domain-containing protein